MTPKQQSILERYGIQNPPEWSGMQGQGADAMYSVGGRWMKAGQAHPSGYTVKGYDPKTKALNMSIHGVDIPVGMKGATILPSSTPRSMALNEGTLSDADQQMMKDNGISTANLYEDPTKRLFEPPSPDSTLDDLASHPQYNINKDYMKNIKSMMLSKGVVKEDEMNNILHISDYAKRVKEGTLDKNTKYYIPNANGDTDVFMLRTPENE